MINLSDFIYTLFLSGSYYELDFLKRLYKENPTQFLFHLKFIFYLPFREEIYKELNIEVPTEYTQEEIDSLVRDFSLFFYSHGKRDYLLNRGVTKEQIEKYRLGSTHPIFESFFQKFLREIKKKYSKSLIKDFLTFQYTILSVNRRLYKNFNFVTIPSFDTEDNCWGICYRSISFKRNNSIKNLYKFHFTHGPIYLFNKSTAEKYNKLIITEGVFDTLALERLGFYNSVSLGNNLLSKYQYSLIKDKELIFIYDNDRGGLFGLRKLKDYAKENSNIKKLLLTPERNLDLDELSRKNPKKSEKFLRDLL